MAYNHKRILEDVSNAGKYLSGSLCFNEVQAASIFNEKTLQHRCFQLNFAKVFRTLILWNICEGLLLRLALLCVNKKLYF